MDISNCERGLLILLYLSCIVYLFFYLLLVTAPKPPQNVQIVKASNSTMILTWISPNESVIDHYVVRYRPFGSLLWKEFGMDLIVLNINCN